MTTGKFVKYKNSLSKIGHGKLVQKKKERKT